MIRYRGGSGQISGMHFLVAICLTLSAAAQKSTTLDNHCDLQTVLHLSTPCTSCAASSKVLCPRGFKKTTQDIGLRDCSFSVNMGDKTLVLSGCRHNCDKNITENNCCPGFWGSDCISCPTWSERICNWHGRCLDGETGNGTCVCEDAFTGFACQDCKNQNTYGEDCSSECDCVHGVCSNGVHGNGTCICEVGYTGARCDQESPLCLAANCGDNSVCNDNKGVASCGCIPGFRRAGRNCTYINRCFQKVCDHNAQCKTIGTKYECTCKDGYQGDGKVCIPVDRCLVDNGGCPANTTNCVYKGPGKVMCVCKPGMESRNPTLGCKLKACSAGCDKSSTCEIGLGGTETCTCKSNQIGDGKSCFGNIMESILELNKQSRYKGKLSNAIQLFEKSCLFTLSRLGPFTVFVPALNPAIPVKLQNAACNLHVIIGQLLFRDLRDKDFWTLAGEPVSFKDDKSFHFHKDPSTIYRITQSDLPAANGIIHIINQLVTNIEPDGTKDAQKKKTIREIIVENPLFSRFETLLEHCENLPPLNMPGTFTVFVPTNEAVDQYRDGTIIYLLTQANAKLEELVRHHVYSSAMVTVDRLSSMSQLSTMANQIITINVSSDGRIKLDGKSTISNHLDIIASNGVIHVVDAVLIPSSIVPILPHRCDVVKSKIVMGPCVECHLISTTSCPPGSTDLEKIHTGCEYAPSVVHSNTMTGKCAKYCNKTVTRSECCKGFYGPNCKACLGGFQNPCYGRGNCSDGIEGDGTCHCAPGFKGIACHICINPNRHGENCEEDCHCLHGVCDNRPGSRGVCRKGSCADGYTGDFCDRSVMSCGPSGLSQYCHVDAVCDYDGSSTRCICKNGYKGDGFSCRPIDLCQEPDRGGCSLNAICTYLAPGNASCTCNEGWTGDGQMCVEINNCFLPDKGGCDVNADCIFVGPAQSKCICKEGYQGDGISCDPDNPCLENNGGCHSLASCKFSGAGQRQCICPKFYGGDGSICYGNVYTVLRDNSDFSSFFQWIKNSSFAVPKDNLTVLVPSEDAIRNLDQKDLEQWRDPYLLPYLVRVHFLEGMFSIDDLKQEDLHLPTLNHPTEWEIKVVNETVMIQNANILISDIPAVNGYIHIIDKVLIPPLADVPAPPPSLMQVLNQTSDFSIFRDTLMSYNLTAEIEALEAYTLLVPLNKAIEDHLNETQSEKMKEDVVRYHIIKGVTLLPQNLRNGVHPSTLLGQSFEVMFHIIQNETFVNEVPLEKIFNLTKKGIVMAVPQILEVHENRCDRQIMIRKQGDCGRCNNNPRCPKDAIPLPLQNDVKECSYRKKLKKVYRRFKGCMYTCLLPTQDQNCCNGYFGAHCFKCPGKPGNWCSGNGECQDGIFGSGECLCKEGFQGTACEMCEPGRFGQDCKSNCSCVQGKCLDGMSGNGTCLCYKGWKGKNCSIEIVADACNGTCDPNANCIAGVSGTVALCLCSAGFQGNGTFCSEINPCDTSNGYCSEHANCTKIAPGERKCVCKEGYYGDGVLCLVKESNCREDGGCHRNAICVSHANGTGSCVCKLGFKGDGYTCTGVCEINNGGCHPQASCYSLYNGIPRCFCRHPFTGDGYQCNGSVKAYISSMNEASIFYWKLMDYKIKLENGPFTVFVPHKGYIANHSITQWVYVRAIQNRTRIKNILRYHIVSCQQLLLDDLQLQNSLTTTAGSSIEISVKEGTIYLNNKTKIVKSDIVTTDGIIHFIDDVLIPEVKQNRSSIQNDSIIEVAEAYGYTIFAKLLKETSMLSVAQNRFLQPFTMLWPTDSVFNALPEERKTWLYSKEHRDKLEAYIKVHMFKDKTIEAFNLPGEKKLRSLYGSEITFSCSHQQIGDILVDNGNAKIVEVNIEFNGGIAHGIDQLLEPPNIGARCDSIETVNTTGHCSSCSFVPICPSNANPTGNILSCSRLQYSYSYPQSRWRGGPFRNRHWPYFEPTVGCQRECYYYQWVQKCCKNHYGRDCQVCPGGLEAPCSNHGRCIDGTRGTGECECDSGFTGVACELCIRNHYGPNCTECKCTENGTCTEGLDGDGSCFCKDGWTGKRCESELEVKPICTPECNINAVCHANNICECGPMYDGDGRNCTVIDMCQDNNGDCHEDATCTQSGLIKTCQCLSNYTGDGYYCAPINPCTTDNGDCSDFALCIFTGANARRCECQAGYVGNGIQCLEKAVPPVDRCQNDNGGCHPQAICSDLHYEEKTAGVFHLQSPAGKYMLNYTEAEAACQEEGATLATFLQLSAAQQLGYHLCIAGWLDSKLVGYPTTYPSLSCGKNHVGIVEYRQPLESNKYDAFCYRVQDVSCVCQDGYIGDGDFCNGNLLDVLATNANFSSFYLALLRQSNVSKSGEDLLEFLSDSSIQETLFVPTNSGFDDNETLFLRDLEFHISTNNSFTTYTKMLHGSIIPSRLGYNLTVLDSFFTNRTVRNGSKLINDRLILEWDIPAMNGIIHIIEGPLKAPPPSILTVSSRKTQTSNTTVIFSVLLVFLLISTAGGVIYWLLKCRNNGFQFQYFKDNDEDEAVSSGTRKNMAMVSIPNPLFSGFSVFADPFNEAADVDNSETQHILD
ncbi:stabilin-1 isoform X3 [Erpetoichthys calabaricus]|uniref:stabilin-1 isoform X3 n=1 Tax=Erpetoichthys calabaricus TaxID=27687 RepID=UPI0022345B56|nr:stabilin-1 isoform X3 [Erpetoichthys calabaricus]